MPRRPPSAPKAERVHVLRRCFVAFASFVGHSPEVLKCPRDVCLVVDLGKQRQTLPVQGHGVVQIPRCLRDHAQSGECEPLSGPVAQSPADPQTLLAKPPSPLTLIRKRRQQEEQIEQHVRLSLPIAEFPVDRETRRVTFNRPTGVSSIVSDAPEIGLSVRRTPTISNLFRHVEGFGQ